MKKKIYGRKVGSKDGMVLLVDGDGVSTGGVKVDQSKLDEFSVESARRTVRALRERDIEGYVVFEGDPARYEFTPGADFVYPASSFPLDELNPGWVKGWGVARMAPWDFAGLFLTKKLADDELATRGADYVVGYGSRRLGSNDFVFD
jgi:hypothetical protein